MPSPASLYFHIPFCTRKCDYCHFYVIPDKETWKADYMKGLLLEWQRNRDKLQDKEILSIYFGGGTPFLLGPERIGQILSLIQQSCSLATDIEITLEANPENITQDAMQAFSQSGINRVSIGIQTLDDNLLTTLTRQHNGQKAQQAVLDTFQAGINNISIDLMYDLPNQQLSHWETTLNKATQLPISHLSLYNLTFEPHTAFFKKRNLLQTTTPNPETSLQMIEMAIEKLSNAGLTQYEISAFAKKGYISRHNYGYWTARPFLGFGPSAFSYWEGKRFRNHANLSLYCKKLSENLSPIDFEEELDPAAKIRELLTVELRLCSPIPLNKFPLSHDTLSSFQQLASSNLLTLTPTHVSLTPKGRLFYDTIASTLI